MIRILFTIAAFSSNFSAFASNQLNENSEIESILNFSATQGVEKEQVLDTLKGYLAFKRSHQQEVAEFKENFGILKLKLKSSKSKLSTLIRRDLQACGDDQVCRGQVTELITSSIGDIFLNRGNEASLLLTCKSSREADTYKHVFIAGSQQLYNCGGNYHIDVTTAGPGLFIARSSAAIIVCMRNGRGKNYGAVSGAALGLGAQTGLFAGQNGLCTMVSLSKLSIGAYAGFATLEL